jgi:hypothetical protein
LKRERKRCISFKKGKSTFSKSSKNTSNRKKPNKRREWMLYLNTEEDYHKENNCRLLFHLKPN